MKETSRMNVPATFEGIAQSAFFLVIGTGDYLQEVRDKGDSYQQILMARALKKPAILMLDRKLHPLEQEELRNCWKAWRLLGPSPLTAKRWMTGSGTSWGSYWHAGKGRPAGVPPR